MYKNIALILHFTLLVASAQTSGSGSALSFDGTTADYVIVNPFNNFPSNGITIEFWMRTADTTKEGTPISYATSGEDNMLFIEDYRNFRFRLDGTAIPASGGSGVSANDGQWHHIAMVWRNTGLFLFYRDAVIQFSAPGTKPGFLIPSGGALVIGQEQDSRGGGFQTAEAFLGTIDELRIWNIQRDTTQIRDNRHRSLVGNETGLVLYYRMDESSGTSMTDSSGDGHTGTLSGATRVISSAPVGLPVEVDTLGPISITANSAQLRGFVDPNGLTSVGYFEWGTSPDTLVNVTPQVSVGSGSTSVSITHTLTGLQPSTTYAVRAAGSSVLGLDLGLIYIFTTLGPPVVTTGPATSVTGDNATLTGTVDPRGFAGYSYFEYGLTTSYGFTSPTSTFNAVVTNVPINIPISGLTVGQTYHYRCVAMNPEGVSYGANRAFITQTFGEAYNFTGFHYTDAAWGDYDNDRDLDLILTGTSNGSLSNSVTRLYRNLGDGTFGLVTSQLPPLGAGLARWGDFDNDGRLDLLVMGHTDASNRVCQIRRSNGNGTFTDVGADLPGMSLGAAAWGDYDRDGDLDLIVTGTTNGLASGIRSRLLHNNGDLTFSNGPTVGAVARSAVAWADIDNDGDLDLALAGLTPGNTVVAQIIRNTGTGFSFVTNLTGVRDASVAWGDYDGDGDPDLVLTGTTNVSGAIISGICQIWRNDGMAGFALVNTGLPGITGGNAVWGDYDNDGDLDLAIVGARTNGAPAAILYRNDGDHTFTSHIAIPGIQLGSAAWGDFDNDGDLDLAVVGTNQSGAIAHIRQNDSFPANTLPTAPSNLVASSTATSATFSWSAPNDEQTPPDALTYNIRINGGLVDPQADLNTGYRKLPAVGNREHGTNATLILTNFPGGTYTWSVQAIDTAFAGGAFAPNAILELVGRPNVVSTAVLNLTTESATLRALVNPGGRNTTASFDFGADTNYGTELGVTNIGNAFSNILVFTDVEGLLPDTVYHFRATALNVLGTDASADVAFRTLFFSVAPSPLEVTLPPGAATNVSITLSNHIASAVTITNRFRTPIPTWAAVLNPTFVLAANSSSEVNLLLDATGLMPATYQATLEVVSGSAHAVATVLVRLTVLAAEPAQINSIALQPNGSVLLAFTGTSGYTQTVFASTNLEDWTAIGPATQISPGQFQFTDPGATNFTQRFYKVRTL